MAGYKFPYYSGQKSPEYWSHRAKENLAECFGTTEKVERYLKRLYEENLKKLCHSYNRLMKPFVIDGEVDAGALAKAMEYDEEFRLAYKRINDEIALFADQVSEVSQNKILLGLETAYKNNIINTFNDFKVSTDSLALLDKRAIEIAVRTPFTKDSKEFSARIWGHNTQLAHDLRETLSNSIANGDSIQKTAKKFIDLYGNTVYNTERIIRTETLAVYAKSSVSSYKELGIEKLEVLSEHDTCDSCATNGQEVIPVRLAQAGVNIPPFHPNCKCCVKPIVEWED